DSYFEDVLEVAVRGHSDSVDLARCLGGRRVEQSLDLLLGGVSELPAVRGKELDAVVLGRVVRGGDDGAEVEGEQRDGRRRQDAREHRVTAGRRHTTRKGVLELGP